MSKKATLAVFPITKGRFAVGYFVSGGGRRWKATDVFDDQEQVRVVLRARQAAENAKNSGKA